MAANEWQLSKTRAFEGLDAVLAPGPCAVTGVKERDVEAWSVGQKRGDAVSVGIKQRGFCARMQGVGMQVDPGPGLVVL